MSFAFALLPMGRAAAGYLADGHWVGYAGYFVEVFSQTSVVAFRGDKAAMVNGGIRRFPATESRGM